MSQRNATSFVQDFVIKIESDTESSDNNAESERESEMEIL